MKIQKSQWIVASVLVAIGFILFVIGIVIGEVVLMSPGLAIIIVSGKSLISLWKLSLGDTNELEKYRAGKDERIHLIWDKAAAVGFWVAFAALMAVAFIYLIVLDMFLEGMVVFSILIAIMVAYLLAVWYYSKKY